MLEINERIHDQYTLEFKVGYSYWDEAVSVSDFTMNTWIFIPDVLYITPKTYSKSNFYRDVRSLVRFITPVYTLKQIADPANLPAIRLRKACLAVVEQASKENMNLYEHQIKMFGSMVRSAVRTAAQRLNEDLDFISCKEEFGKFISDLRGINALYRGLKEETKLTLLTADLQKYHAFGDEYICRVASFYLFQLLARFKIVFRDCYAVFGAMADEFLNKEAEHYIQMNYIVPVEGDDKNNMDFLSRSGQLKKYIESDLYLLAHKRSNTFVLQQILFMLAAGMSMIFATVISFSFQQTYGNFTEPFFIALVVSYMFKDRLKDLLRYWFSNKMSSKFYDYRIKLAMHGRHIGWGKEGFDFVNEEKLPQEVKSQRGSFSYLESGTSRLRENVIFYRRRISLFGDKIKQTSHYLFPGVNEIIRINLRDFLRRTGNPHIPVYAYQGKGAFHTVSAEKVYYLHFIVQFSYQGKVSYKRYRVQLNRRGLKKITEF